MQTTRMRKPTPHDVQNILSIKSGYGDWWDAKLIRLIAEGDAEEYARLEKIYPAYTDLLRQYRSRGITCRSDTICERLISEWCASCRQYYCDTCYLNHADEEQTGGIE